MRIFGFNLQTVNSDLLLNIWQRPTNCGQKMYLAFCHVVGVDPPLKTFPGRNPYQKRLRINTSNVFKVKSVFKFSRIKTARCPANTQRKAKSVFQVSTDPLAGNQITCFIAAATEAARFNPAICAFVWTRPSSSSVARRDGKTSSLRPLSPHSLDANRHMEGKKRKTHILGTNMDESRMMEINRSMMKMNGMT